MAAIPRTDASRHDVLQLARIFASDALDRTLLQYRRLQDPPHSQFSSELHFFLGSTRDVRQAALILKSLEPPNGPVSKAIMAFDRTAGTAKTMRDVGDHIDAYVLGNGRVDGITHDDLCFTGLTDDGNLRCRGVTLNIHEAVQAAKDLYRAVSEASQRMREQAA